MNRSAALLDTNFLIHLLNDEDNLYTKNTKNYFKYFLENKIVLKVSTINIAEYCVQGNLSDLPLKNIKIIPFNFDHAKRTGEFVKFLFKKNIMAKPKQKISPRAIIPNDSKLLSQADLDKNIKYFVTSDGGLKKNFETLKKKFELYFKIIDIKIPHTEAFRTLTLF